MFCARILFEREREQGGEGKGGRERESGTPFAPPCFVSFRLFRSRDRLVSLGALLIFLVLVIDSLQTTMRAYSHIEMIKRTSTSTKTTTKMMMGRKRHKRERGERAETHWGGG